MIRPVLLDSLQKKSSFALHFPGSLLPEQMNFFTYIIIKSYISWTPISMNISKLLLPDFSGILLRQTHVHKLFHNIRQISRRKQNGLNSRSLRKLQYPSNSEFNSNDLSTIPCVLYSNSEVCHIINFFDRGFNDILIQVFKQRIHVFRHTHELSVFFEWNIRCFSIIPDFSVVLFLPDFMLASAKYPMKAHKNQQLLAMPC